MSELRDRIAALTPEQRRRLEERLRSSRPNGDGAAEQEDAAPPRLSFGQERLWNLAQRMGDSAVYTIHTSYRLRGPLDVPCLQAALRQVVDANGALRVVFAPDTGTPTVTDAGLFDLPVARVADLDAAVTEAEEWIDEPLGTDRGPLFGAHLWRIADDDHLLTIRVHHLVCDGWSLRLIEDQLAAAYNGADVDASPHRFSDFVAWERNNEAALRDRMDTWSGIVAGAEPLRLPGARAGAGGEVRLDLGPDVSDRIDAVAARLGATAFRVLLAAFAVALNRHTGQDDVVVCTPVAGRPEPAFEEIVGYFNDIVPIRARLDGDPTAAEIVDRLREGWLASIESPVPFQWIAEAAHGTALTRGLFALNVPKDPPALTGLDVEPVGVAADTSDFGMDWLMRREDGSYRATVRYQRGGEAAYRALADTFVEVADRIAADPEVRLSGFPDRRPAAPADEAADRSAASQPTSAMEARLKEVWERVFRRPLSVHDDFFDLGGHSLLAAELIAEVEAEFDLDPLPLSTLFEAPTVAEFARLLESGDTGRRWESLVPIKPSGDRPPLFFVHAHGGNVIGYSDLGRHLSPDQPLYGLQAPRTDGEIVVRRLEDIAAGYIEEMRTVQPHGPYVVGGWCLGGDIAFEIGRQLRAAGEPVALVIMVDNPRNEHQSPNGASRTRRFANKVATRLEMEWTNLAEVPAGGRGRFVVDRTRRLVDRAVVAAEKAATRSDGTLPFGLEHGQGYRQEEVAAVHGKAYATYQPGPYDGAVAIFRAERQPRGLVDDPTLGWGPYLEGPVYDFTLPGFRIGMLSEPRIERSAPIIEEAIAAALAREETG